MNITSDVLLKIRRVYRLTQAELAALCGVDTSFINMIERGKRNVTERVRRKLIEELALTPEKLARIYEIYDETDIKSLSCIRIPLV